jgi:hypothetical protein
MFLTRSVMCVLTLSSVSHSMVCRSKFCLGQCVLQWVAIQKNLLSSNLKKNTIFMLDNLLLRLMSCDRLLDVPRIGKFSSLLCCHSRTYWASHSCYQHNQLQHIRHRVQCSVLNLVYSEDLCKEQMRLYMVGIGPWIRFPDTLHELLAHLPAVLGIYDFFLTNLHLLIDLWKS